MNSENLRHLPAALREAAAKLPAGRQHTVLELPPEGQGHNAGLIKVAAICYRMGVSYEDTLAHLQDIYSTDRIDYRTAPERAVKRIWGGDGEIPAEDTEGAAPDMQEELLLRFRRTTGAQLLEASPHKTKIKPRSIIKALFDPADIINIQHTGREAGTLLKVEDLEEYEDTLHSYKFLNPSTFKKVEGVPNPLDGDKVSTRCNANVKARPYMVLEMDSKDDAQVERFTTYALELSKFAPLVLAVDTGNKSIHFWFDARAAKPEQVTAIFNLSCLHGADKALGVRSQIARMPNVSAADEGRGAQRVLYYDPDHERAPEGDAWDVVGFEEFIARARQLDYYYLGDGGKYYMQSNSEAWISLNRTSLTNQLIRQGFRAKKVEGEALSPTDAIITDIEMDKSIEAAMKGASGRHAGYYEENGFRFLVLKSPRFIKPRKGGWPTIKKLYEHMFGHAPLQLDVWYGWLSQSAKDLRNGGRRRALFSPAQMVNVVGGANSGKTLNLKYILPYVFGGRAADADSLFCDQGAAFNSDLFQSELLFLDDSDVLQPDYKFRAKFGERIKSYTVGAGGSYHQKFGDKVGVQPWWRIIRMMNAEPTTIATLPPLEDGIADKLILLKTQSMDGGLIDNTAPGWFDPVRDAIEAELPAFLHFLLEEYRIPQHVQDPSKRYAVMSYHNPDILALLNEDSAEASLIHKIDTEAANAMFFETFAEDAGATPWEGTAQELHSLLADTGSSNAQIRFRQICPSPRTLAAQLRSLAKSHSTRVLYSGAEETPLRPIKRNGNYYWHITPVGHKVAPEVTEDDCF